MAAKWQINAAVNKFQLVKVDDETKWGIASTSAPCSPCNKSCAASACSSCDTTFKRMQIKLNGFPSLIAGRTYVMSGIVGALGSIDWTTTFVAAIGSLSVSLCLKYGGTLFQAPVPCYYDCLSSSPLIGTRKRPVVTEIGGELVASDVDDPLYLFSSASISGSTLTVDVWIADSDGDAVMQIFFGQANYSGTDCSVPLMITNTISGGPMFTGYIGGGTTGLPDTVADLISFSDTSVTATGTNDCTPMCVINPSNTPKGCQDCSSCPQIIQLPVTFHSSTMKDFATKLCLQRVAGCNYTMKCTAFFTAESPGPLGEIKGTIEATLSCVVKGDGSKVRQLTVTYSGIKSDSTFVKAGPFILERTAVDGCPLNDTGDWTQISPDPDTEILLNPGTPTEADDCSDASIFCNGGFHTIACPDCASGACCDETSGAMGFGTLITSGSTTFIGFSCPTPGRGFACDSEGDEAGFIYCDGTNWFADFGHEKFLLQTGDDGCPETCTGILVFTDGTHTDPSFTYTSAL